MRLGIPIAILVGVGVAIFLIIVPVTGETVQTTNTYSYYDPGCGGLVCNGFETVTVTSTSSCQVSLTYYIIEYGIAYCSYQTASTNG
jgi:hypothetical protein